MIFNFVLRGKSIDYKMNDNTIIFKTLLNLPLITSLIGSIMIVDASLQYSYLFTIWSLLNSYASCFYHYTEEVCCKKLDVGISLTSILFLFYEIRRYKICIDYITQISLSTGFYFLGLSWSHCRPRKNQYYLNHSIFHLLVGYAFHNILLQLSY